MCKPARSDRLSGWQTGEQYQAAGPGISLTANLSVEHRSLLSPCGAAIIGRNIAFSNRRPQEVIGFIQAAIAPRRQAGRVQMLAP